MQHNPEEEAKRRAQRNAVYTEESNARLRGWECTAAMNGIPDPAKFMQTVRDAVEAGAIGDKYLTVIRDMMKGTT